MIKSDVAAELSGAKSANVGERIARCEVEVDEVLGKKIGKPPGKYVTVESDCALVGDDKTMKRLSRAIAKVLLDLCPDCQKPLTVGLGNRLLTADALGAFVLDRLIVEQNDGNVVMRALAANVVGVTGIESYDVIRGVVDVVHPDLVIAVDSLCAAKTSRIGTCFQISNAGITPGSGVKNARQPLSRQTLGVQVIAVGVPMVVYASTILAENGVGAEGESDFVLTPKDVDVICQNCARVIADAINFFVSKSHLHGE